MLECLLYTTYLEVLLSEHGLQGGCHKQQQIEIIIWEIASKLISLTHQKKTIFFRRDAENISSREILE